ncbi:MAG TPA: glycosyltransferase family 39 protein [Patescibacteria group bacterium]|nr:glycosyltransferase family 39 protein [Patescibacteria group bacterium]
MFTLAILIITYSYSIFLLGMIGWLREPVLFFATGGYIIGYGIYLYNKKQLLPNISFAFLPKKGKILFFSSLLLVFTQCLVNIVPVFGPELGFDALWYHLTLPKIYLLHHAIIHILGGLLYYTDMPKLVEMLYVPAIAFMQENGAKFIHFLFGILCLVATFAIGKKLFSRPLALIATLIVTTNLVFSWESSSAYIDLGRTFFELLAFWSFLNWTEQKKQSYFVLSAVFLGAAITTKLIAIGSLLIFIPLIFFRDVKGYEHLQRTIRKSLLYVFIALSIALPWFVFSYIHTGNPVYPLFSSAYPIHGYGKVIDPLYLLRSIFMLFTSSPDPLSPVYALAFPLLIAYGKRIFKTFPYLFLYSLLSLLVWYITPQSGGGRFILPYLPQLSLLVTTLLTVRMQNALRNILIASIYIASCIGIFYRFAAAEKYIPAILGSETKQQFLAKNLNFSFGDFADTDGYFATHIKKTDTVLLYGFHNLYYVDFPFVDNSWVKKWDTFDYVAIQNTAIPNRFRYLHLVYSNSVTHVQLYTTGNTLWTY